jgi:cytochrome P450
MSQLETLDVQSLEPGYTTNPHSLYAQLREETPVRRVILHGVPAWLVTRFDDVRAALTDPRLSHDVRNASAEAQASPIVMYEEALGLGRHMLRLDPPDHTRLRRLVTKAFTPRRVEALRPRIQQITDELIAQFLPRGRADLVEEFSAPLPLMVISELLGVPAEDRADFHRWSQMTSTAEDPQILQEGLTHVRAYLTELVAAKTAQQGADAAETDLLAALVAVREGGDQLSEQELLAMVWLLLTAGHVTTQDLISNGMLALLQRPDQLAALRQQPELLPSAIEEFVRYENPLKLAIPRFTLSEVEIGGVVIPGGGEVVFVSVSSAGRDAAHFADPDRVDITRPAAGHVGFGHGIHYCVGAPLARMEGAIAVGTLLGRCADIALAVDASELSWRPNPHLRNLIALPVTFTSVSAA